MTSLMIFFTLTSSSEVNYIFSFFFIAELAARLGLAFYIFYLIIFEVHAVNCSYREDTFMNIKKN